MKGLFKLGYEISAEELDALTELLDADGRMPSPRHEAFVPIRSGTCPMQMDTHRTTQIRRHDIDDTVAGRRADDDVPVEDADDHAFDRNIKTQDSESHDKQLLATKGLTAIHQEQRKARRCRGNQQGSGSISVKELDRCVKKVSRGSLRKCMMPQSLACFCRNLRRASSEP